MASSIPEQTRAVDPYASYNSNTVNQLTGIVTRGDDALDEYNSLQVDFDTTSAIDHVVVYPGIVYKDDVYIKITKEFRVNFSDPDHYIIPSTDPFDGPEEGIYYIVLEYAYVKSRPAPQAQIKILVPSQTESFRRGEFACLFFLKAVRVALDSGGDGVIQNLYDYDPDNPDTKREYVKQFLGGEVFLPPFDPRKDISRIIYVSEEDECYMGFRDGWKTCGGEGSTFTIDTSGFQTGDLVYINAAGNLTLARALTPLSSSDGVVIDVGVNGKVKTDGEVLEVKPQSSITPSVGDLLYLSKTEPGRITTQKTFPARQFVGRCKEITGSSITMLYHRGEPFGLDNVKIAETDYIFLSENSWTYEGTAYKNTIDVSQFKDSELIVSVWDATTNMRIKPLDVVFEPGGDYLTVWMPVVIGIVVFIIGTPKHEVATGNLINFDTTLLASGWTADPGGSGLYYQNIDVSSLQLAHQYPAVTVADIPDKNIIKPANIESESYNNIKIWMPNNSLSLSVNIVGISVTVSGVFIVTTDLAAGAAWVEEPAGSGMYYQDIDISQFGFEDGVIVDTIDINQRVKIETAGIGRCSVAPELLRVWMSTNTKNVRVVLAAL